MFSKKATKIHNVFTDNLTVTKYYQIDGEDFVTFCGLLRKRELYLSSFKRENKTKLSPLYFVLQSKVGD